jgi:putative addiction module killer protein
LFARTFRTFEDPVGKSAIAARIERAEQGNFGGSKPLGDGIWEMRIAWGPGYRVYFGIRADRFIVLLALGRKDTQRRDLQGALNAWRAICDPQAK